MAERSHIAPLTGLRFFAAFAVMLFHFREVAPGKVWHYPIGDTILSHGGYGVDLFFILSGFILTHVYGVSFSQGITRAKVKEFLAFRFARLYPVHVVTIAFLCMLYLGQLTLSGHSTALHPERYSIPSLLAALTMTHAWFGLETPDLPSWSISAEWFVYLLFPFFCLIRNRFPKAALIFVCVGGALISVWQTKYALPRVTGGFLIGMALYPTARHIIARLKSAPWFGCLVVVAAGVWFSVPGRSPRLEVSVLLFALLIVALTNPRDWLTNVLAVRICVYLGEISYSVYMFHWIARILVRTFLTRLGLLQSLPGGLVVSCYVLVTMCGAVLLYHVIERPWRRRLRAWIVPRRSRVLA